MWSSILMRAALLPSTEGSGSTAAIARQVRGYARQRGGGGKGDALASASLPPPPATTPPAAATTPKQQQHDRPPTVAANAIAAAAAARARAAEAAAAAAAAGTGASPSSSAAFDAARASAAPRVHALIGDPRTGVADDTTSRSPAAAASNDISVELIWNQENPGGVEWYRYTPFSRQQPHMRRDSRLSDHSRNLLYLLRCADPAKWTVEALARKFRVRRQRVLAVLALKEMEAQALEDGRLMGGGGAGGGNGGAKSAAVERALIGATSTDNQLSLARGLRAYCMTVDLADVRLHTASREPHDLADAAAADAASSSGGKQQRRQGNNKQQQQQQDLEWTWARPDRKTAGSLSLGSDPSADLARVAPAQAVTAQRLHTALLSLLQQHGFSADALLQGLLAQVDAAEAHYEAHVRGTGLERALELGWRAAEAEREAERLAVVAAERARLEAADPWAALKAAAGDAAEGGAAAEDAAAKDEEGGDGESTAATTASSSCPLFDFSAQRAALTAAVDALRPLLANAGPRAEREAAALAAELSALLGRAAEAQGGGEEAAGAEGEKQDGDKDGALRAAAAAASPDALARAFNALPRDQRQALLDRAPAVRAALDLRGADLTAVVNPFVSQGGGGAGGAGAGSYAALSLSSPPSSAAGGGATAGSSYALGRWPGQVRPLVDVWGYEEVGATGASGAGPPADPDALFAGLLGGGGGGSGGGGGGGGGGEGGADQGALVALERAVADLDRCALALGIQGGGGVSSSSPSSSSPAGGVQDALGSLDDFLAGGEGQQPKPQQGGSKRAAVSSSPSSLPTCADVLALREDLYTYQHIDWLYDRAVDHQAAELVAAAAAERAAAALAGTRGPANTAAAAARLLAAPPRRVSETPGAWDTPPLPAKQQQRMLRLLRALDPSAAERLMYLEALSREDRAAGAVVALGGRTADGAVRRAARMREQVTRVLRHMDEQLNGTTGGGEEGEEGGEEEDKDKAEEKAGTTTPASTTALPPRPSDLPSDAPASARAPLELVSAFIESTIVGRQYHRGSGERHVALVPTFPSFDGRPLSEASGEGAESELSAAAREAAKREDDSMWRDFRARLLHNLGVSGTDLWDVRGKARPQRPAEGWSMVVHPVRSKAAEGGTKATAIEPRAGLGAPPAGAGRHAAAAPYVSEPGGGLRALRGDEALLEKRRTPKRRRRWPM
jgi:hypothetical protein